MSSAQKQNPIPMATARGQNQDKEKFPPKSEFQTGWIYLDSFPATPGRWMTPNEVLGESPCLIRLSEWIGMCHYLDKSRGINRQGHNQI